MKHLFSLHLHFLPAFMASCRGEAPGFTTNCVLDLCVSAFKVHVLFVVGDKHIQELEEHAPVFFTVTFFPCSIFVRTFCSFTAKSLQPVNAEILWFEAIFLYNLLETPVPTHHPIVSHYKWASVFSMHKSSKLHWPYAILVVFFYAFCCIQTCIYHLIRAI